VEVPGEGSGIFEVAEGTLEGLRERTLNDSSSIQIDIMIVFSILTAGAA
jgi:hypothetical protein